MNKIFKYFMMVVVAVAGVSLASCSDDDDDYSAGEPSDGAYIYADLTKMTYLPDDNQSLTIKVGRTNASGEKTFKLTCDNDKFSAPSEITFKDGESVVVVPVTFNIGLGETETASFTLPEENTTVYGNSSVSITVSRDYTWVKIGTADFFDDIFYGLSATVDVQQAKEGNNLYKFVAPMRTLFRQNGETKLPGGVDLIFNMDEDGNITMEQGIYDIESGTSLIEDGAYQFYYACKQYPEYCYFDNDNGKITFSTLLLSGESLYGPYTWSFDWNNGYPLAK